MKGWRVIHTVHRSDGGWLAVTKYSSPTAADWREEITGPEYHWVGRGETWEEAVNHALTLCATDLRFPYICVGFVIPNDLSVPPR